MDNAMVKRGIGAVVLAIIAALLLGYLLKDKSRERQEVVDMKLPGAPEINIPSLIDSDQTEPQKKETEATEKVTLVDETSNKLSEAGSAVVASATGAMKSVSDTAKSITSDSNDEKPGFSFRPPNQNEEKEIVDTTSNTTEDLAQPEQTTDNTTTVVASSAPANNSAPAKKKTPVKKQNAFKPVIEKEPKKAQKKKAKEKTNSVAIASTPTGKYSIQLLATSSQSRANKLANTMNGEGYKSFITQTNRNNKILYRVRIGGHNDRNAAIKVQESMKRRYLKNFFVQNSLVVSN